MMPYRNSWLLGSERGDNSDVMGDQARWQDERHNSRQAVSTQSPQKAMESQRLYLDNLKLWDCLALVRSDVSLSCQSAINLIFSLSNNEYLRAFPDALHFIHSHFSDGTVRYSSAEEANEEDNRLRQENIRLHAAVWVLRDNPGLQPDSALAAIFRLDDEKFKSKFPFNYECGSLGNLRSYPKPRSGVDSSGSSSKRPEPKRQGRSTPPPRCRSVSAKRKSANKSADSRQRAPPANKTTHNRRSSSMWGREDFTSNRTPAVASWDHPNSPDPPLTITHGVRSQFKRSSLANRSFAMDRGVPLARNGVKAAMTKRSPSASGRIEGQDREGDESDEEAELSRAAIDELHKCTDKLGLEVTSRRSQSRSKVEFSDPLYGASRCSNVDTLRFSRQGKSEPELGWASKKQKNYFRPISPLDVNGKDYRDGASSPPEERDTGDKYLACREVFDRTEMLEPPRKKFTHAFTLPAKIQYPAAGLNKSSNNQNKLPDTEVAYVSPLVDQLDGGFDFTSHADLASDTTAKYGQGMELGIPSDPLGFFDQNCNQSQSFPPDRVNATTALPDQNANRQAYDVDSAGNVGDTEQWFVSFTDQSSPSCLTDDSIARMEVAKYNLSRSQRSPRFSREDRTSGHKECSEAALQASTGRWSTSSEHFPGVQIYECELPAQPILGRPYPVSQYPTPSHFITRLRRLENRFGGDKTCQQPFSEFPTKKIVPEFPVLADPDFPRSKRHELAWQPTTHWQKVTKPSKPKDLDQPTINDNPISSLKGFQPVKIVNKSNAPSFQTISRSMSGVREKGQQKTEEGNDTNLDSSFLFRCMTEDSEQSQSESNKESFIDQHRSLSLKKITNYDDNKSLDHFKSNAEYERTFAMKKSTQSHDRAWSLKRDTRDYEKPGSVLKGTPDLSKKTSVKTNIQDFDIKSSMKKSIPVDTKSSLKKVTQDVDKKFGIQEFDIISNKKKSTQDVDKKSSLKKSTRDSEKKFSVKTSLKSSMKKSFQTSDIKSTVRSSTQVQTEAVSLKEQDRQDSQRASSLNQRGQARLKGCTRNQHTQHQQGRSLLRKVPKTQMSVPLDRMLQRNASRQPWAPDPKYQESTNKCVQLEVSETPRQHRLSTLTSRVGLPVNHFSYNHYNPGYMFKKNTPALSSLTQHGNR